MIRKQNFEFKVKFSSMIGKKTTLDQLRSYITQRYEAKKEIKKKILFKIIYRFSYNRLR